MPRECAERGLGEGIEFAKSDESLDPETSESPMSTLVEKGTTYEREGEVTLLVRCAVHNMEQKLQRQTRGSSFGHSRPLLRQHLCLERRANNLVLVSVL